MRPTADRRAGAVPGRPGRAYVRPLLLACALVPLLAGLLLAARAFRLAALGVTAEATVMDRIAKRSPEGTLHLVFFEFKDVDGATRVARFETVQSRFDALRPRSTLEVIYPPGDPAAARPRGSADLALPGLLLLVAAAFLVAAGLVAPPAAPE